jgi:hypothetical protein
MNFSAPQSQCSAKILLTTLFMYCIPLVDVIFYRHVHSKDHTYRQQERAELLHL